MRTLVQILFFQLACTMHAQNTDSLINNSESMIRELANGDSVVYYQCHVEEAVQQLTTASGQTLTAKPQRYTVTEKFVLSKQSDKYFVNYYTSSLTVFPNRKFSGLKIREKAYWAFKKERSFDLTAQDVKVLIAMERKGREAIEYDYPITRYNTNQLIIRHKKDFKQLVVQGNYVISKLLSSSK